MASTGPAFGVIGLLVGDEMDQRDVVGVLLPCSSRHGGPSGRSGRSRPRRYRCSRRRGGRGSPFSIRAGLMQCAAVSTQPSAMSVPAAADARGPSRRAACQFFLGPVREVATDRSAPARAMPRWCLPSARTALAARRFLGCPAAGESCSASAAASENEATHSQSPRSLRDTLRLDQPSDGWSAPGAGSGNRTRTISMGS